MLQDTAFKHLKDCFLWFKKQSLRTRLKKLVFSSRISAINKETCSALLHERIILADERILHEKKNRSTCAFYASKSWKQRIKQQKLTAQGKLNFR